MGWDFFCTYFMIILISKLIGACMLNYKIIAKDSDSERYIWFTEYFISGSPQSNY